jgi:hypothetical protein
VLHTTVLRNPYKQANPITEFKLCLKTVTPAPECPILTESDQATAIKQK